MVEHISDSSPKFQLVARQEVVDNVTSLCDRPSNIVI